MSIVAIMASAINKDIVLVVSLVLSVVSLVLLFGVTWYFQSSLDLLQQQVEYDRELLFKLQEQQSIGNKSYNSGYNRLRRQADCQCKDGIPGPRGSPGEIGMEGRKGDAGPPGSKGDTGDRGPRGGIGDQGYPGYPGLSGAKGEKGNQGDTGPRGDTGDRGPRGIIGDTGLRGPVGQIGVPGIQGNQGPKGYAGDKGDIGPRGKKGEMGYQGLKGTKGDQGQNGTVGANGKRGPRGLMGYQGLKGSKGEKGNNGSTAVSVKGDKEERNGGTVYVRWGHDQCPSTAHLVYSGRAGGPHVNHAGGGSNPQCLPLDPNFLTPISGRQDRAYMYGAEYETNTNSYSHIHGRHDHDVPCAVCHVSNRTAVYMVPAKYTCPTGWTRECYGYLMAAHHRHPRFRFTCMDDAFKSVVGSSGNYDGLLFYFIEGRCGSLPCPPYDQTRELSCAVCTK